MTPKSIPKSEAISRGAPLVAPLVAQTAFGHQKWTTIASKVFPMIEKSVKHDTKEPPDCAKELQKSSRFGAWPGGLLEALTINRSTINALDHRWTRSTIIAKLA